jgi:hypothetical protein
MKYPTGEDVRLGDRVELWPGCIGVVVAVIDRGEYGLDYPEADWKYLKAGILINSDMAGLIHYLEPERTLKLKKKSS